MLTGLAVLGGGNMGGSVVRALAASGFVPGQRLVVAEPDATRRAVFALEECRAVGDAASALRHAGPDAPALIAVKPQAFETLALELAGAVGERLVISIMAGVRAERVRTALGGACRVVRVMPNLPVSIGLGMSAVTPGPGATPKDLALTRAVFETMGRVEPIDESMMDAFTALAGSGPAYLFYLAEGLLNGAVSAGFTPDAADRIVRQTLLGAAELLASDAGVTPTQWRERVTSKGGTTAAACTLLDARGVMRAIHDAVLAARDRGSELG
jgi:pyrroline-5-carboxylate reductase